MNINGSGKYLITGLVVLLVVLHQDNWFWEDSSLVFGIVPVGLFYHACISLAAAATWFLATKIAWPLEDGSGASPNNASGNSDEGGAQ